MSWELFYTSAPRGLKAGSRGFCTVARTEQMPTALIDRLESLSSYPPALTPGLSLASAPVSLSHWRVPIGARTRSVLSRVAPSGSDYSGRMNKLAYHRVLEPGEAWDAGPLAMLTNQQVMQSHWEGEPRLLHPARVPSEPPAETPNELPTEWTSHAERLAEAFTADAGKSSCIVYRPTVDPTPLLSAALLLLEPRVRWQVTFTTLFSELAAGLSCHWRCAMAGSLAASEAPRHASSGVIIELSGAG